MSYYEDYDDYVDTYDEECYDEDPHDADHHDAECSDDYTHQYSDDFTTHYGGHSDTPHAAENMSSSAGTTNEHTGYTQDSTGVSYGREDGSSQTTSSDYASYTYTSSSDQASDSHVTSSNSSQTSMYSGGAFQDSYTDSSACLTPSTDDCPPTSQPKPYTITTSGTNSQVRPPLIIHAPNLSSPN